MWICNLLDQIAIYICTSDELDQRLTVCPSVLDDATDRVPDLQSRAGCCPSFRCGGQGVGPLQRRGWTTFALPPEPKELAQHRLNGGAFCSGASVHPSPEARISVAIYRRVLRRIVNAYCPVVSESFPYYAMITRGLFSEELYACDSQILFLIGTSLATAFPLCHLSEHNGTKFLISIVSTFE